MKKFFLIKINFLRNVFEVYIPICTFSIMFIVFVAQIFARYIFNYPLTWAYEVTVSCFAWTVILGACYGMRTNSHVRFSLFTDYLKEKHSLIACLFGNLILLVAFSILIIPSAKYIFFMGFQSTSVFKIKLSFIFSPFLYFIISVTAYILENIINEIKSISKIYSGGNS